MPFYKLLPGDGQFSSQNRFRRLRRRWDDTFRTQVNSRQWIGNTDRQSALPPLPARMAFLGINSKMADAIRAHNWSKSPLGPLENWPTELKTSVSLIINSSFPQCLVWGSDLITIPNDAFLPILGDKPPALGRSFADVWSEAWDEIAPIAEKAFGGEATYLEDFRILTDRYGSLEEAYFTFCYSPVRDAEGNVLGMLDTVTETTRTVLAERQLQAVNRELAHRLKNTMAVTQAIVRQTIKASTDIHAAADSVEHRLSALARATDLLTKQGWQGAELTSLTTILAEAHGPQHFEVSGPPILFPSELALNISLGLHELATNAQKYGCLQSEAGKVCIDWEISGTNEASPEFALTWSEAGSECKPPRHKGFGTTLIERVVGGAFRGDVHFDYQPDGLRFTLRAPWDRMKKMGARITGEYQ